MSSLTHAFTHRRSSYKVDDPCGWRDPCREPFRQLRDSLPLHPRGGGWFGWRLFFSFTFFCFSLLFNILLHVKQKKKTCLSMSR